MKTNNNITKIMAIRFFFLHLDLHQDRSFLQENTYIYYSYAII